MKTYQPVSHPSSQLNMAVLRLSSAQE